jgi:phospholipid transport system substrate-binding protein
VYKTAPQQLRALIVTCLLTLEFHLSAFQSTWGDGEFFRRITKEVSMIRPHKLIMILGLTVPLVTSIRVDRLSASTPGDQVKATIDRVMETLKDPRLRGDVNKNKRREKLRQTILPRFDFADMAKRALGSQWNRYPDKQREFVSAFTQLLEESYADQIEAARGDKVDYVNERTGSGIAEVDTKVISSDGQETPIFYKLHPVGSDWKVYDVVIANISLVNNYRSQFSHILSHSSFDDLIKMIKEKSMEKNS